jgi:outer membrane immunogenic protein
VLCGSRSAKRAEEITVKGPIAAITLCFAATAVTPALSADLGVAPTYKAPAIPSAFSWSGFYIGGHLGGAWASDTVVQSNGVAAFSSTKITSAGFAGGGQLGYNWIVAPNWLLAVEADISGTSLDGTVTYNGRAQFNEKAKVFGTVRGRAGYLVNNNWLFYGTGGFAWDDDIFTRTQISATATTTPPLGDVRTNSGTRVGWTAGGGVEWGFTRNWTARVEYLHLDLADRTFSFNPPNNVFRSIDEGRLHIDTVRAGVNYLFN